MARAAPQPSQCPDDRYPSSSGPGSNSFDLLSLGELRQAILDARTADEARNVLERARLGRAIGPRAICSLIASLGRERAADKVRAP